MPRKAPGQINKLAGMEQFKLMKFVETNYAATRMHDAEFAAHAAATFGFEVTKGNVAGAREALGIESTLQAVRREAQTPQTRLDRLEARLDKLEAFARSLEPGFGK